MIYYCIYHIRKTSHKIIHMVRSKMTFASSIRYILYQYQSGNGKIL